MDSIYGNNFITLKGVVNPKMKMSWKHTPPQATQDEDEFVSSEQQIWINLA